MSLPADDALARAEPLVQRLHAQGVRMLLLQFTDLEGVAKGKLLPLAQLPAVLAEGAGFAGPSIVGTGLPRSGPRSEFHARGDATTAQPLPWWPGVARLVGDGFVDGQPFEACPRQVLRRQLDRLAARVAESETRHGGEIRVSVEAGLPPSYVWQRLTPRDRAIMLFGKLRVWDTEANNGVLIYVLLAEHAIEIVADRGVARHVPPGHWAAVVARMREAFRAGRYEAGLLQAVEAVEALLVQHSPLRADGANPNELSDRVDLR